MRWRHWLLAGIGLLTLPNCSVNILQEFGDPTTDAALYYSARMLMNDRDYAGAITKITSMSAEYLTRREVKTLAAAAYAGRCGLDFIDLVTDLSGMGATRLFPFLVATFRSGSLAKEDDCIAAENYIKAIDTSALNRTSDENLLMAFIALAKIGTVLSRYTDVAPADGTADAGFDACGVTLPSADAKEVATGVLIAMDALGNIGGSSVGSGALSDIAAVCGALIAPFDTLCMAPIQVDTSDIDANEEKAIRTMLKEDASMGLGTNCTGDVTVCNCP